jgi:hypothetical protein
MGGKDMVSLQCDGEALSGVFTCWSQIQVLAALFLVLRHPYLLLYCQHKLLYIGRKVSYISIIFVMQIQGIPSTQINCPADVKKEDTCTAKSILIKKL